MDIKKTIDYLENVLSSEVRLITIEKQIKEQQSILDYSNDYYEYLKTEQFQKILIPTFYGVLSHSDAVKFEGDGFNGTDVVDFPIEHGYNGTDVERDFNNKGFCLKNFGSEVRSEGCMKTYGEFVNEHASFFEGLTKIYKNAESAIRKLVHQKDLGETAYSWGAIDLHDVWTTKDFTSCFNNAIGKTMGAFITYNRSSVCFSDVPRKVPAFSPEEFRTFVHQFYSYKKYKYNVTSYSKGLFGKTKLIVKETDRYSPRERDLIASALYPFYVQALEADNSFVIECYKKLENDCLVHNIHKEIAEENIVKLEKMLQEEKETREKLYGLDVIFPKYRHMIAVGSFIDYFSSGRCTSFDGPDGAYNLYENELRLDRITDRLDTVIDRLDQIARNQHAMYLAVKEMNRTLDQLNGMVKSAASQISNTIRSEAASARGGIHNLSSALNTISANTSVIAAKQEYANKLLHISNERQQSIIHNQEFEQMLYTDPSVFGGKKITNTAHGRYH